MMRRAGSSPRSSPHTMVRAHTLVTCASLRRMLKPDRLTAPPAGSGVRVRAQCRAGTQAHRLQAQGLVRAAAWARLPGSVCAQRAARSCAGAWNTVCLFHDVAVENMPTCHSRHGWKDRLPVLSPAAHVRLGLQGCGVRGVPDRASGQEAGHRRRHAPASIHNRGVSDAAAILCVPAEQETSGRCVPTRADRLQP